MYFEHFESGTRIFKHYTIIIHQNHNKWFETFRLPYNIWRINNETGFKKYQISTRQATDRTEPYCLYWVGKGRTRQRGECFMRKYIHNMCVNTKQPQNKKIYKKYNNKSEISQFIIVYIQKAYTNSPKLKNIYFIWENLNNNTVKQRTSL